MDRNRRQLRNSLLGEIFNEIEVNACSLGQKTWRKFGYLQLVRLPTVDGPVTQIFQC